MNKLALTALAVTTIAAMGIAPAFAQQECRIRCGNETTVENCGDQLGHLKRVYPAEVAGIDNDHRVWVTEFCLSADLMRSDGNAAYLRTAIADNDVLVDVLRAKGYFPEDVYAVKMMGDDTINLFVHRFEGGTSASLLVAK